MLRLPRTSYLPGICLAGTLIAAACSDSPAEPEALLGVPEYRSALRAAEDLPTVPRLIDRIPVEGAPEALSQARIYWEGARRAEDSATAEAWREASYRLAAPVLAAWLDSADLAGAQAALERWIRIASWLVGAEGLAPGAFEDLGPAVAEAAALLGRAREAAAAGDRVAAIEATLQAADRLEVTTPPELARRLILRAETTLAARRREGGAEGQTHDVALRRAQRLTLGARQAFAEADYVLALQRSYYALRLLEAE